MQTSVPHTNAFINTATSARFKNGPELLKNGYEQYSVRKGGAFPTLNLGGRGHNELNWANLTGALSP